MRDANHKGRQIRFGKRTAAHPGVALAHHCGNPGGGLYCRRQFLRPPAQFVFAQADHPQSGHPFFGQVRVCIKPERGLQSRQGQLVNAHGPEQLVFSDAVDKRGLARDNAGLRAAEDFIAAEGDHVHPLGQHLPDQRFAAKRRRAQGGRIKQQPAAQILNQGQALFPGQGCQLPARNIFYKTDDPVI